MPFILSQSFDAGSVEVVSLNSPDTIQLRLRTDNAAEFKQWFYFRLTGAAHEACTLRFLNAHEAAYPQWEGYQAVASYDRVNWFRVPTTYENGELIIRHTPLANSIYYAYFEPYSYEKHLELIGQAQGFGACEMVNLGQTPDGHDLDMLIIGNQNPDDLKLWVIARQHPGETMAEWFAEGFLDRLLDPEDPIARVILKKATVYVVPNMNPDGAVRGNLRTNARGANLNREWLEPSLEKSPEVFWVREKMLEIGVDFFLDVHGDEALPYIFVAGCEGVPHYSEKQAHLETLFKQQFKLASADFQEEHGYLKDAPGTANLSMATAWVGETFSCLAFTLEMPFKDNANLPDEDSGWNGQRSLRLGEAVLSPLYAVLNHL